MCARSRKGESGLSLLASFRSARRGGLCYRCIGSIFLYLKLSLVISVHWYVVSISFCVAISVRVAMSVLACYVGSRGGTNQLRLEARLCQHDYNGSATKNGRGQILLAVYLFSNFALPPLYVDALVKLSLPVLVAHYPY